ncbi:MAG: SDR family NAD(P)-dependent oxidoreductase [Anaerolineaceae bacterium]|nr:SDR family NAD(P)-dependent oxidoreductase [Anaerolineaceae bacterium]
MTLDLFDLTGKVAVVTGATGVLCSEMCRGLAQAGATVVAIARNLDNINTLVTQLQDSNGTASGLSADVLDKTALHQAAEQIIAQYGRIDILINGAGGNRADASSMPGQRSFFDLPEEAMQWVFNLNFTGAVIASQVFGKVMTEQQSGVILNISSMASYQPMTRVIAYSAAKAAINNFTHWLAVYMAKEHSTSIRVNAIAPGFFLGNQNRYLLIDKDSGNLTERGRLIIEHTPMNRFGEPQDLVGTMLWLVSDASRFVTGIVVPVDGGFMAYKGV